VTYRERKSLVCDGINASHMWRLGTSPFKIDVFVLPDSSAAITLETGVDYGPDNTTRIQLTEEQAIAVRDVLLELWPLDAALPPTGSKEE